MCSQKSQKIHVKRQLYLLVGSILMIAIISANVHLARETMKMDAEEYIRY